MERTMYELKVYTSREGAITIEQQISPHADSEIVVVHPDQVDTLIRWLEEARGRLRAEMKLPRPQ